MYYTTENPEYNNKKNYDRWQKTVNKIIWKEIISGMIWNNMKIQGIPFLLEKENF